ncbi:MAG TPA: class I SAM-dependent methyltransferase [Acidimicrobiales bacterium]|jgi:SAM-dependent methyltransferase|nr:class I SAM-dependent methyltransferase [Acidimicrobiales bacterium]
MARDRRDVFGEAVDQYANARPGYPEQLVDDVLAYGDPASDVLEVGAGTGKATVAFAARGVSLTCLEPDPRMAARLEAECASFSNVSIVVTRLEQWVPPLKFDVLIAAQSWHWVDRARRWDLAHNAVRTDGTIALFWNKYIVANDDLRAELEQIDERYDVDNGSSPNGVTTATYPEEIVLEEGWPAYDLASDARFEDLVSRRYRRTQMFSTATYLDLLASTSAYRIIDGDAREALMVEVASVIEQHGGETELNLITDLFLGRAT